MHEIAKMVPAKYRKVILLENHIQKAFPLAHDANLIMLWFYWANFIEEGSDIYKYEIIDKKVTIPSSHQCGVCFRKLIDKWKLLEPYLVALEVDEACLNNLK